MLGLRTQYDGIIATPFGTGTMTLLNCHYWGSSYVGPVLCYFVGATSPKSTGTTTSSNSLSQDNTSTNQYSITYYVSIALVSV